MCVSVVCDGARLSPLNGPLMGKVIKSDTSARHVNVQRTPPSHGLRGTPWHRRRRHHVAPLRARETATWEARERVNKDIYVAAEGSAGNLK
jgi:hypothetical protein